MSTLSPEHEATIRSAVAERLSDEGIPVEPGSLALETATARGLADLVLFRGTHGEGERTGVLQGTLDTATGAVNTFPNDALVQVWKRWLDAGGLPDAVEVTSTSLFLIGGTEKRTVVLHEADREAAAAPADRKKVQLPRLLDRKKGTGVVFWWLRGNRLSEVTLRLADRMIELSERDVSKV